MTKRSDNLLRETPLKRVPLGPIVDPQDSGKSGEVGVVLGEVPVALFELLQLPRRRSLLNRVAKDAGDLGEECCGVGAVIAIWCNGAGSGSIVSHSAWSSRVTVRDQVPPSI